MIAEVVKVVWHPSFEQQYLELLGLGDAPLGETTADEVFADVTALVYALQDHGRLVEGFDHTNDISHPITTSTMYELWALRRSPETQVTPHVHGSPYIRIPYVWVNDQGDNSVFALVLFMGDKTDTGSNWYPRAIQKANDMIIRWEGAHGGHRAFPKR